MKIVISGGSGHVGALLDRALASRGDDVVVLSREPRSESGSGLVAFTLGLWVAIGLAWVWLSAISARLIRGS